MKRNIFLAALPDRPAARAISALAPRLAAAHGFEEEPFPEARYHVTLVGLGLWSEPPPSDFITDVIAAAAEIDFSPFAVQLEYAASFGNSKAGRHPYVLFDDKGVEGLNDVRDQFIKAFRVLRPGLRITSAFQAHLTLLYDRRRVAEHRIAPIRWTVRELVLVESLSGRGAYLERSVRRFG